MVENERSRTVVVDLLADHGVVDRVQCGPNLIRCVLRPSEGVTIVSDWVGDPETEIRFARVRVGQGTCRVDLGIDPGIGTVLSLRRGLLLHVRREGRDLTLWFPCAPFLAQFDQRGRLIRSSETATIELTDVHNGTRLSVNTNCESEYELCIAVVVVADQREEFEEEVRDLCRMTHAPVFKSDWFVARSPLDLWKYLIDGEIFDPRPSRQGGGRFKCQQCGFAWWSYLQGLHRSTGLGLLRVLAREVAWSVRAGLQVHGEWSHGFWCEPPETHMRFVFDGLHLLISEGEMSGESEWIDDAKRAMESVIQKHSDTLDGNELWFLHDSLELDAPASKAGPRILGAARGNTLCLNTHVQALSVLHRLRLRGGSEREETFEKEYLRGMAALRRILSLQPAELLYKFLGGLIIPAVTAKNQPGVSARLRRVFIFRMLRKPYWFARRRYPRLVYPNGFIERDMSSSMLADDYHVLNLKDLLTLQALDPQDWLQPIINRGIRFLKRMDLRLALGRSPLFVEAVEILRMSGGMKGGELPSDVGAAETIIREVTGGVSLDDACRSGDGLGLEMRER